MKNFRKWLNESVKFADIQQAIKKTLEFVVADGTWQFERETYGISGMKTASVAGHFRSSKGRFFLSAHADATNPIDSYDPMSGTIDSDSKVEIIASLCFVAGKNSMGGLSLKTIGERSRDHGGRLNTPYELAEWVKAVIDRFGNDNDDDDEDEPMPMPSPRGLALVGR